jgi:hypothetical protein
VDKDKSDELVRRLTPMEVRHLAQCIEHAFTKPHYELTELVPILIDGHHHIGHESSVRIKVAIKRLSSEELTWIAENAETLVPD